MKAKTKRTQGTQPAAAAPRGDASPKAGEPPAQAGDAETKVATAQPQVKLPTEAEARKELEEHPERHSVLSQSGHVVRER